MLARLFTLLVILVVCGITYADVDVENDRADSFTLSAYARIRYTEFGGVLTVPEKSFSIESAGLTADFVIDDGLEGQFQLEARPGEVFVKDCFLLWEPLDNAGLRVGRFKKPFCLNTLTGSWDLLSIDHSISHRELTDLLYSGRDIGATLLIDPKIELVPELILGLFNGSPDPLNQDNDLQYAARLEWALPAGIDLGAGLSMLRLGETDVEEVSGYITSPRQVAWGVDLRFDIDIVKDLAFLLDGEYVRGDNWDLADVVHGANAPIFETWWLTGGFAWKTDTPVVNELVGSVSIASWKPDASLEPREDEFTVTLGFNTSTPVSVRMAVLSYRPHEMMLAEKTTDYLVELLLDL